MRRVAGGRCSGRGLRVKAERRERELFPLLLGHAKTDITNDIYLHALPSMQKDAAAKLSSLLR